MKKTVSLLARLPSAAFALQPREVSAAREKTEEQNPGLGLARADLCDDGGIFRDVVVEFTVADGGIVVALCLQHDRASPDSRPVLRCASATGGFRSECPASRSSQP